jgi:hypothetical protein
MTSPTVPATYPGDPATNSHGVCFWWDGGNELYRFCKPCELWHHMGFAKDAEDKVTSETSPVCPSCGASWDRPIIYDHHFTSEQNFTKRKVADMREYRRRTGHWPCSCCRVPSDKTGYWKG